MLDQWVSKSLDEHIEFAHVKDEEKEIDAGEVLTKIVPVLSAGKNQNSNSRTDKYFENVEATQKIVSSDLLNSIS